MKLTLIACLVGAIIMAPGFAQTQTNPNNSTAAGTAASKKEEPAIPGTLMKLEFLNIADGARRQEVLGMLDRLYGRNIRVAEGKSVRIVSNLQMFGDSIVLYDIDSMIGKIKDTFAKLNQTRVPKVIVNEELVVREYKPRFISTSDAYSALAPFARDIDVEPRKNSRLRASVNSRQRKRNVTILNERGLIIMRDTASHLDKMLAVLKSIDQPKTQFMVSCMLIQGSKSADDDKIEGERLKKILPSELRDISPYKNFQMVSSGVIRVAAGNGKRVTLSMSGSGQVTANLMFIPTSFDPKSGTLGLGEVSVDFRKTAPNGTRTQQAFETTTTIQMNDYVVIGAFGDNPVFAVLHLIPVK
ncbi:MAG: hypothetical protein ACI97A_000951 [Planctomycetota bacterium]|jgi:hypothetical protein